jgi:hypothetical protein
VLVEERRRTSRRDLFEMAGVAATNTRVQKFNSTDTSFEPEALNRCESPRPGRNRAGVEKGKRVTRAFSIFPGETTHMPGKGMVPSEFYEGFVLQDFFDWEEQPSSLRRAMHLSISAGHLADHYCRYHQRHSPQFEQIFPGPPTDDKGLKLFLPVLYKREPTFQTIRHMANALKHLYTRATCNVASGGAVWQLVDDDGLTLKSDFEAREEKGDIVIQTTDGLTTLFSVAIRGTMDMWSDILSRGNDNPWTG